MSDRIGFNRRDFLKFGAVTLGMGAATPAIGLAQSGPNARPGRQPKNIIFMVSDGMSASVPGLADALSQLARGKGTHWYRLMGESGVVHGLFDTASLNSMVTDSAAAATAWGSGTRVFNGELNILPDGTRLTPIAQVAKGAGRRVGLVTTCTVTHATPAGFAATQRSRDDESIIAPQYMNVVDVIMGGGKKMFDPKDRLDKRDLLRDYRQAGYALLETRAQLTKASRTGKILGLFDKEHLPYTVDWNNQKPLQRVTPTLAEMTRAALETLSASPGGFLLQVEGGRVDHAAHNNDAAAMLWDQIAFDDAIGVVLEFVQKHPDTLVVITSDHGNSNPGLNGMGENYARSTRCFERIARAKASYPVIQQKLKDMVSDFGVAAPSTSMVLDVIKSDMLIELSRDEARTIGDAIGGQGYSELHRQHANTVGAIAQAVGNHTGIGWCGTTHTSEPTLISALGPGSELFAGMIPNTAAFDRIVRLMGVNFRNPRLVLDHGRNTPQPTPAVGIKAD